MKTQVSVERPKLFLFKFLAHQIHPFAYAVNTFLEPALDDCRLLIEKNPQETLNVLLSLAQTFTRFAPESEIIYDDIQQFSEKIKDTIDRCLTLLDEKSIQPFLQTLDSTQRNLTRIAQQRKIRTGLNKIPKKFPEKLYDLEKLNSLPVEIDKVLFEEQLDSKKNYDSNSSINDLEVIETLSKNKKKPMSKIAAFPPKTPNFSLAEDIKTCCSESIFDDDNFSDETSRNYYLDPRFSDPLAAQIDWRPVRGELSTLIEKSTVSQTLLTPQQHVTDEFLQRFETKRNFSSNEKSNARSTLRGEISKTFGKPQPASQSNCLPIGVGLSYDETLLLSCDVHRSAQTVRIFDIETSQLRNTISSNQKMKFHRPSAVMSNQRNQLVIVERELIYTTELDGRLVETYGHRSIKQLYGITTFHDRYLLTIDSKATDNQSAENTRLLLFDPNSGQLVLDQPLIINQQSTDFFDKSCFPHITGKLLPRESSKPRFIAVSNDDIFIADLGRSLIYKTSIRDQFQFQCATVFGGQGRAPGEMVDPSGLFIDSGGNVISADSKNDRIQIFDANGEYKTTVKLNERIKRPSGICTNRAGTQFYVSCYLAGCVRSFNISY